MARDDTHTPLLLRKNDLLGIHQPNGDHEHRPSRKLMNPEDSDEELGTEVCHCGMIRHVNAEGEPVAAWYVNTDSIARPLGGDEGGPGGPRDHGPQPSEGHRPKDRGLLVHS